MAACPGCDRRVQGRHPDRTSDAIGAAAVQFGPNLLALAADLKHRLGVPFRKAAEVIGTLIGQPVSAGALARSGHRLAGLARPTYDGLVDHLRDAPVKHADETGWRIGGRSAWLWVFADSSVTIYRIRKGRATAWSLRCSARRSPVSWPPTASRPTIPSAARSRSASPTC